LVEYELVLKRQLTSIKKVTFSIVNISPLPCSNFLFLIPWAVLSSIFFLLLFEFFQRLVSRLNAFLLLRHNRLTLLAFAAFIQEIDDHFDQNYHQDTKNEEYYFNLVIV